MHRSRLLKPGSVATREHSSAQPKAENSSSASKESHTWQSARPHQISSQEDAAQAKGGSNLSNSLGFRQQSGGDREVYDASAVGTHAGRFW